MSDTEYVLPRSLKSYSREELRYVLEQGARCVTFHYCYSLIHTVSGESDVVVVRGWWDGVRTGWIFTLLTAILGWWGIHGIFLTPYFLLLNLSGGQNVSRQVYAALDSDVYARMLVGADFDGFDAAAIEDGPSPDDFLANLENQHRAERA